MMDALQRIINVATLAEHNPRFEVIKSDKSIHVKLDGWDVGTINYKDDGKSWDSIAYNEPNLRKAEEVLIYGILNTYGDFPDNLLPEHLKKLL